MVPRATATAIRVHLADRASRLIALGGTCLLLCLTLLGVYLCLDLRDVAWHNARRNAANLLAVIEEGSATACGFTISPCRVPHAWRTARIS